MTTQARGFGGPPGFDPPGFGEPREAAPLLASSPTAPVAETHPLALSAILTGALGLPLLCVPSGLWGAPFALNALVTGMLALRVRRSGAPFSGTASAVAGVGLGAIGLVLALIGVVSEIAKRLT